jgi:hypothetical protein
MLMCSVCLYMARRARRALNIILPKADSGRAHTSAPSKSYACLSQSIPESISGSFFRTLVIIEIPYITSNSQVQGLLEQSVFYHLSVAPITIVEPFVFSLI